MTRWLALVGAIVTFIVSSIAGAPPWLPALALAAAIGAWAALAIELARRPRAPGVVEAALAAFLSLPPGLVLGALVVYVVWLRPLVEQALDEPAGDTPGVVAGPAPPNPLEGALPLGAPLPIALAGTTVAGAWLAVLAWRLGRPRPETDGS